MKKIVLMMMAASLALTAGAIDRIKDEQKIRIGIKYDTKPFGFKEGRKIKGFDLDLSKLIVAKIEKREKIPKIKTFYKKVVPANRETMLADGRVDMVIATYTITDERKKRVAFSVPYFTDEIIIVQRSSATPVSVGILENSTSRAVVERMGYKTTAYRNYDELFRAFESGKIDAISSDGFILKNYIKNGKYTIIKTSKKEEFGIGLPKEDEAFKKLVNEILMELKKDGEYEKLYRKWFK